MSWNFDRKQAFRAALLGVYRSYSDLKIFTRDALDKNLEAIASSRENLTTVVFELVEWAEAKKRLADLYRYFCDDNPDHEFSQSVETHDRPAATFTNLGPTNLGKYRRAIPKFVGRDRAMDQLSELLADNEMVAIAAVVSGMGGLGKTELAWQWANREYLAGRFPGGVVWLDVAAGNPGEQLVLFCQSEFDVELPELPMIAGRVAHCWQHWTEWRSGEVLVVFDDVSRERDAAKIKELQPSGEQFRALWTTRDEWAGIRRYRLDKLDNAAARSLLASYIDEARLEAEPEALEQLLRWFGGLPLGLELAARYLALDDWLTIADYLSELTLTHESLQENPEMRYPDGVEAAIAISWGRLNPETEDGQAARRLAMRLGLFGAAPIPVLPEWRREWRKPLQRLVNLNLVERDEASVALHPLVRQFVRGQLAGEEADELKREVAAAIVEQGERIEHTFTMAQARESAPWMPHLEEVVAGLMPWITDNEVVTPLTRIGFFHQSQGLYELAERCYESCVTITRERLGDMHVKMATALNNLAELYRTQKRYESAEPLYYEALTINRDSLPSNHSQLASALNNLALLYTSQGRYESAEPLLQEAVSIDRCNLPEDHLELAASLNNLAGLYLAQGKYGLAEPLFREVLSVARKSLKTDHPNLATYLNNLAVSYQRQGKYASAEALHLESLEIFVRGLELETDHPDIERSLCNVTHFYQTAIAAGLPDTRLRNHPLGDLIRSKLSDSSNQ